MKTIKQLAGELGVSKQAVWQRVKRTPSLSALLPAHSNMSNGRIYVDGTLEQCIKEQYPPRNIEETSSNARGGVDETGRCVDETGVNARDGVDETGRCVDETGVNTRGGVDETDRCVDETGVSTNTDRIVEALQQTVSLLQQQLSVKDKQIDDLTAMLKTSQEQQATLSAALTAAQALHAGTIQERLGMQETDSDQTVKPEAQSAEAEPVAKQGFFAKLFRRKKA